jgi:murein DD-endopeptidase MepM/ murein hydrolase activator NlpD
VPGPDLFDLSQSQDPPPGGFTQAPPIDPARRALLLSDEYVFPVVGGASYSQDFGAPRAETGFHQGIDLFAPTGTPLVAVHDGTLFKVGWNHLGGRRLWLEDGHGNAFYYAHLSAYAPLARDGARVRAGDVIGFVGASGDAVGTPPHVHFEIHPARRWAVPPFAYVSAWRDHAVPSSVLLARSAAAPGPAGTLTPLAPQDISSVSGLDVEALLDVGVTPTP